jgi:hypothetical protein
MEEDDLLAALGVTLPTKPARGEVGCGAKPPKAAPIRHTTWSNAQNFTFGGYLARVRRIRCETCEGVTDVCEGIFIEEIHLPSGTRRLQQMGRGMQWPAQGEHRCEVHEEGTTVCGHCVRDLGFSRMVDGKGEPYSLVIRES